MTKDRTQDKRQRILDAALKIFARRGFYTAKVAEVAREAGVADGTIYLYFANKDDLLISLFEDRMDFLIARLTDELAQAGASVHDRFRALIRVHLRLAIESPDLAEFITVELRQSGKFVKEYGNPKFQAYLGLLYEVVDEGQRTGHFRSTLHARTVVRAMFGALDEILLTLTLRSATDERDIERATNDLASLFLHGLDTREGASAP